MRRRAPRSTLTDTLVPYPTPFRSADHGSLYLLGHCHQAGGERRFRIDRIHSATLLDDTFTPPAGEMATTVFSPDADDPRIVLDLEPAAWWVAEAHPVEEREERPDGCLRVTLAIGATAWLERPLVALGPRSDENTSELKSLMR